MTTNKQTLINLVQTALIEATDKLPNKAEVHKIITNTAGHLADSILEALKPAAKPKAPIMDKLPDGVDEGTVLRNRKEPTKTVTVMKFKDGSVARPTPNGMQVFAKSPTGVCPLWYNLSHFELTGEVSAKPAAPPAKPAAAKKADKPAAAPPAKKASNGVVKNGNPELNDALAKAMEEGFGADAMAQIMEASDPLAKIQELLASNTPRKEKPEARFWNGEWRKIGPNGETLEDIYTGPEAPVEEKPAPKAEGKKAKSKKADKPVTAAANIPLVGTKVKSKGAKRPVQHTVLAVDAKKGLQLASDKAPTVVFWSPVAEWELV